MTSPTGGLIYQLLPKLMEKVGPISKDRKNPVGFKYRGIEDALNNMQPALIELGLTVEFECRDLRVAHFVEKGTQKDRLQFQTHLLMDVTFVATDGSKSKRTAAGEGLDTAGDKATNKAMAAAFKYAVFLGLCIPVEDGTLTDPDASGVKINEPAAPVAPMIPTLPAIPILPVTGGKPVPEVAAGPKVTQTVQEQIIALVQANNVPNEVIAQLWAKHGVQHLYDLSSVAGDEVLALLKTIDLERQAQQTFFKG